MEFWLKKDENNKFRLPVNPSDFFMSVAHKNTIVNVHALGDINLIGKTGLAEGVISSIFPAKEYNFSNNADLKDPYDYIALLEKWRKAGEPIRLIITGTSVNMEVTIESLSYGEQDSTGDVYYSLSLKQYKKIKIIKTAVKVATLSYATSTRVVKSESVSSGKTYTVVSGDTLWKISKKFYGDGSKYNKIYEANKSVLKNPNAIYPKQVITIP